MNTDKLRKMMVDARKRKDTVMVSALSGVIADIELTELRNSSTISEEGLYSAIRKAIKVETETRDMFLGAEKPAKAEEHGKRIEVLETLLPTQLSEKDSDLAIGQAIFDVDAHSMKDMGKVMASLKTEYGVRLDMAYVSKRVKELLLTA